MGSPRTGSAHVVGAAPGRHHADARPEIGAILSRDAVHIAVAPLGSDGVVWPRPPPNPPSSDKCANLSGILRSGSASGAGRPVIGTGARCIDRDLEVWPVGKWARRGRWAWWATGPGGDGPGGRLFP